MADIDIDKLLDEKVKEEVRAQAKAKAAGPEMTPGAEKVNDVQRMKELIAEVIERAYPKERQQYIDAGHRMVTLAEAPLVVDGIIGQNVVVPQFRWLVRQWLDKNALGTEISRLANRQYTGRWEPVGFRIVEGSEGKMSIRVAADVKRVEGVVETDGGDVMLLDGAKPDTYNVLATKTLQVYIVWIDAVNAPEVLYDKKGEEVAKPINVVVQQPAAPVQVAAPAAADVQEEVAKALRGMGLDPEKVMHWKQREKLLAEAKAEGGGS